MHVIRRLAVPTAATLALYVVLYRLASNRTGGVARFDIAHISWAHPGTDPTFTVNLPGVALWMIVIILYATLTMWFAIPRHRVVARRYTAGIAFLALASCTYVAVIHPWFPAAVLPRKIGDRYYAFVDTHVPVISSIYAGGVREYAWLIVTVHLMIALCVVWMTTRRPAGRGASDPCSGLDAA